MANEYVNKVVVGTETKLDLTADTITAADLKKGATAHDKSGTPIVGTNENDVNSADATAAVAEVLTDKTFYARGSRLTGTMPNIGKQTGSISVKAGTVSISQGYHDGSGSIGIAAAEQTKMIPANIKQGVTILGVEGSYGGETVNAGLCAAGGDAGRGLRLPCAGDGSGDTGHIHRQRRRRADDDGRGVSAWRSTRWSWAERRR